MRNLRNEKKEKTFAGADASWTTSRHVSYRRYDNVYVLFFSDKPHFSAP
jgi:hypothetical protein